MTTHTHTAGPWIASNNFVYADGYNTVIAECDTHATALLIAACPDLLAALEDCMFSLALYIIHVEGAEHLKEIQDDVRTSSIARARAAINKAKGGD